jgi:hypothetical protein
VFFKILKTPPYEKPADGVSFALTACEHHFLAQALTASTKDVRANETEERQRQTETETETDGCRDRWTQRERHTHIRETQRQERHTHAHTEPVSDLSCVCSWLRNHRVRSSASFRPPSPHHSRAAYLTWKP